MTSGTDATPPDPDHTDGHHPESVFPHAGERVGDDERHAALDAMPEGNATVGDMVDSDGVDSRAHEAGPGAQEVDDQVHGHLAD